MTFVVNLTGIKPPQRFDGQPWTQARLEQTLRQAGPFSTIEVQPLSPVDPDPAEPAERNFTTNEATIETGWFRAVFIDADGAESATAAVRVPAFGGGLDLAELKAHANITRDDDPAQDELLQRLLDAGFDFAKSRAGTGRRLEPWPADLDGYPVTFTSQRLAGKRFIRVPDAREIASVVLDDEELTADDYQVWRHPDDDSPVATIEVFARGPGICEVTGHFGFHPLPRVLKDAIYTHVSRNFYKRAALFVDVQASDEYGDGTYLRFLPFEVRDVYQSFRVPADRWAIA